MNLNYPNMGIIVFICAFFITGCASVSSSSVPYVTTENMTEGPIFITQESLPDSIEFEVIGQVKANARAGYSKVPTLYPLLVIEARKVGANAVINVYAGRSVAAFSWAARHHLPVVQQLK